MSTEELKAVFDKHEHEYIKFDSIAVKRSNRPDLHAFLLLDQLVPSDGREDIIGAAEHDEFFLSVSPEELAAVATEEQIVELIRCGLRYDTHYDSLAFFA